MADYYVSLYDSDKFAGTPAEAVRDAGFSWQRFSAHPVVDQCRFYGVSGPDEIPEWMRPLHTKEASGE